MVFGLEYGLSDWECDGPDRSEFGLQPREPRGQLASTPGSRARPTGSGSTRVSGSTSWASAPPSVQFGELKAVRKGAERLRSWSR